MAIDRTTDRDPARERHFSGILVMTRPDETASCVAQLEAQVGVEVHYVYPDSGRIIAVQETATARAQEEGLRRIQALTTVELAALVEHRIEQEREP